MTAINTDNEVAMEVMRLAGVVDEIAYHLTNVMFGDEPVNFDKAAVTAAFLQFDNAADWQAVSAVSNRVTEMERLYARLMCYTVAP